MVGPCDRILPQWLRAPCNGSGPATSTQYEDSRTLGQISTSVVNGARQHEWPRHLSTHTRAEDLTHNVRSSSPIRYTSRLCIPHTHKLSSTHSHTHRTYVCFRGPIRYSCQLCLPNTHMHAGPYTYTLYTSPKHTHIKGQGLDLLCPPVCPGQVIQSFAVELRCHATGFISYIVY